MANFRQVALVVNCGYARVCIYRNSNPDQRGQYARQSIDTTRRAINFREQFSTYCLPESYFKVSEKKNTSQFDRDCNRIIDGFKSNFPFGTNRDSYLDTFSSSKWYELSVEERKRHSLGNCARCFELHRETQESFPLKPFYHHKPVVTIDQEALQRLGVKKFTTGLLTELNQLYQAEASTSFTDALVQTKSSGLEKKKVKKKRGR